MSEVLHIDAATWARIGPLLDEALTLPESGRAAWLERLPAAYDDVRPRLRALLEATTDRLPAGAPLTDLLSTPASLADRAGERIGPWRLLKLLGHGGMGEVWLAERADGLMRREVALKLPLVAGAGALRTQLAERMARERNILAALVHPGIARLYDAGLGAAGEPYLAMELVEGDRIDRHAAAHALDVAARVRLMLQAVRAVAYSHAHLVVHRDIKPPNLLVDRNGQVKLLDFGIAKLWEPESDGAPTEADARIMTPAYASPEQLTGGAVGAASDIYALGVVLYELLASRSPYHPADDTRGAFEQAVLHEEPARPSDAAGDARARKTLRGDLDTIVLKALKKAPAERYATADALADDLQRWLDRRPVLARPDSLGYLLSRLVRRHRLAFGAVAAVLAAIVLGAGAAAWQARVALAERQRADEVKNFVAAILRDANAYEAGDVSKLTALGLVHQARERLAAAHIGAPEVKAELELLLGESLLAFGDVEAADTLIAAAESEARARLGAEHSLTLRLGLALSQVDRLRGRAAQRRAALEALLPRLRERAADEPALLVVGLQHAALGAIDTGSNAQAVALAAEGTELARRTLGPSHPETLGSLLTLAMASRYDGQFERALAAAEEGFALAQRLHPGPRLHPRVVEARALLGRALCDTGRLREGVEQLERTVDEGAQLFGAQTVTTAVWRQNLVAYRLDLGQLAAARADAEAAAEVLLPAFADGSVPHARVLMTRGDTRLAQREYEAALADMVPAAVAIERALGQAHENTLSAQARLALALAGAGRVREARTLADRAAPQLGSASAATRAMWTFVEARLLRLGGDASGAAQRLGPLLASSDPAPRLQRERARARVELGLAQLEMADKAAAAASFRTALAELATLEAEPTPLRADAESGLARASASS